MTQRRRFGEGEGGRENKKGKAEEEKEEEEKQLEVKKLEELEEKKNGSVRNESSGKLLMRKEC